MGTKFITNTEKPLSKVVQDLANQSEHFDFLVGYFFLSGFNEIKEQIREKKLRILIGMDVEVDETRRIKEYGVDFAGKRNTDSKQTIKNKYPKSLINTFNNADNLDTQQTANTFQLYKEKILNGTLEIRKTKEPNHAKMYLFYTGKKDPISGIDTGNVIVGSSNFSYQGLTGRNEVNVYLQDSNDFEDAEKIFEDFWKDAVPLVNESNKDEFIEQIVEHTWLEKIPSPYLMYIRVLYEYFKISNDTIKTPSELTRGKLTEFFDVSYQIDAIREGIQKVKKHSGVIIADVVGLGKSIIASTIAANLDLPTVIICPPHLAAQWKDYALDFGLRAPDIYTPGKIEDAVNKYNGRSDLIVIIDEAHRYKSENTIAYGLLHQLCAGNKVVLLSATPFNNRPEDIFSLIKLFQIPANSTIQTVNDLGNQMEQLSIEYKKLKKENRLTKGKAKDFDKRSKELAEKIREILDPVVIRRTRVDLEKIDKYRDDLAAQEIEFSRINPPKELDYSLGNLSELYMNTLELLTGESLEYIDEDDEDDNEIDEIIEKEVKSNKSKTGFIGARYKPLTYLVKDEKIRNYYAELFDIKNFETGQRNMAKFMQQLFVRRFESSKYSFIKTVENVLQSMKNLKKWYTDFKLVPLYKKGKLPDFETMSQMTDDTSNGLFEIDDIFKSTYSEDIEKGLIVIKSEHLNEQFIKDLDHDIELFQKFYDEWKNIKEDPKLDATLQNIKDSLKKEPKRKIILFSEFSDTADYLQKKLEEAGLKSIMYSSKAATKNGRDFIRACFDAGIPENMQTPKEDDVDILVATDAISEGFSLHRAGAIYNYDIPYNPTRVIQRIGRINRINKKVFDELFIFNFFPTPTGETISHTEEISTFKMKLFQAILGSDTKVLKDDETTEGYMATKFIEAENEENSESWDIPYRNVLNTIEKKHPELLEKAKQLPYRSRTARKNIDIISKQESFETELFEDIENKGVLLFSKKGDAYRFGFASQSGKVSLINAQTALKIFECEKDELAFSVSDNFYLLYQKVKEQSGIVKSTKSKNKQLQETNKRLKAIKDFYVTNKDACDYLDDVINIANKDCFPLYFLKQINRINMKNKNLLEQIKEIIPENYLDSLIEKDNKIGTEPETILLAEEFI